MTILQAMSSYPTGLPRGRQPISEKAKRLRGTIAHERGEERINVPSPPTHLPDPPPILEGEAAEEYRRIGALLVSLDLMSDIDRHLLARYALAWATWVDAMTRVKATAAVIATRNGKLTRNPYLLVARDASFEMNATALQLGLSPAARLRMGQKRLADDDPWAEFGMPLRAIQGGKSS